MLDLSSISGSEVSLHAVGMEMADAGAEFGGWVTDSQEVICS